MNPQLIVSSLILLAGIIYFTFPYVNKSFFQRPVLTIEIEPNKGITMSRRHLGYAPENDFSQPVNRPEVYSFYEVTWKFDLVIRNNSPYDSYHIELFYSGLKNGTLNFNSKVNQNKPLAKHAEILVPFEYNLTTKIQYKDIKTLDEREPKEFADIEMILTYKNERKTRFNTTFNMKTKELKYNKVSSKKIKKKGANKV